MLRTLLKPFASLTLTVTLLALSLILIYAGTWAQIDTGIWQVQAKYFHSFFCWIEFQTIWPRPQPGQPRMPGGFPMLGGYTIGALLLINLIAAHSLRFKFVAKDLLLIPIMGAMVGLGYLWHLNPASWWTRTEIPMPLFTISPLMVLMVVLGALFVVALALLHGKRTGVILIHLGLIVLLIGEGITSGMASESNMTINVGSYANYSEDIRNPELAVVTPKADGQDLHAVVASKLLQQPGAVVRDANLPFEVKVDAYYRNSQPVPQRPGETRPTVRDAQGDWTVEERAVVGGVSSQQDVASAFVTLSKDGKEIGKYLLSIWAVGPQRVEVDGQAYDVSLRFKRIYHPYKLHLLEFVHDKYTGTEVAKDFASRVILDDPDRNERREVRIWMNHPLRYQGNTFFQSSFKPGGQTTILQVVHNPAATLPYVAIIIAGIGLVVHFGMALTTFLTKQPLTGLQTLLIVLVLASGGAMGVFLLIYYIAKKTRERKQAAAAGVAVATPTPPPPPARRGGTTNKSYELAPSTGGRAAWLMPTAVLVLFGVYALSHAIPRDPKSAFDLTRAGAIPVSFDGRTQPLDTVARNALKVISGRDSTTRIDKDMTGKETQTKVTAVEWLFDTIGARNADPRYKIFRIDHPDIKDLIGGDPKAKLFSLDDIVAKDPAKVQQAIDQASRTDPKVRSIYQRKLAELGERITYLFRVQNLGALHAVPPLNPGETWRTLNDAARESQASNVTHPTLAAFVEMQRAFSSGNAGEFNRVVASYDKLLESKIPADARRASFEQWFNRFDPTLVAMAIYVAAFVFAALSWLGWGVPLQRSALWLLLLGIGVHTLAIVARIYISGRPPVTNLANSSVFIGWGAAVFGVVCEIIFRRGIGSAAAGVIGFVTLLIYHELARDGDTMKVLVAVLDTNIWLATHVVIITLGYSATFLAGLIGLLYIVLGMFTKLIDAEWRKTLGRMMYGVTCFALMCSFTGTILGGIWADQSWGRFWGWDPKENGAVMIVLANAILLHARWGGLVKERGIAVLAVFGNIITAWSWFGTNMLGVGLHSYGFMDSALLALLIFVGSQAAIMLMAATPFAYWRSYKDELQPSQQVVVKPPRTPAGV